MDGNTIEMTLVENKKSIYNDLILYNSSLFKKKLVEKLNIPDINIENNIENILINTFSNFVKADLEMVKNLTESELYKYRKLINWDDLIITSEISEELFISVLDELDLFTIISYFSTAKCSNDFIDVCFTLINEDIVFIESCENEVFAHIYSNFNDIKNMYKSVITNIIKNNFNSDFFNKYYNSNIILLNHEVILSNNIIDEDLIYNKISEELNKDIISNDLHNFIISVIKYQPVSTKIFNLLMTLQSAELYLKEYITTGLIDLIFLNNFLKDINSKTYPYLNIYSTIKIIINNLSLTTEERIEFCTKYKCFIKEDNVNIFKNKLVTGKFYLNNKDYNLKNSGIIDYLFLDIDTKNKIITKAINQYTGEELLNKLQSFYEYNLDFILYVKYVLNEDTKKYENVYYKDNDGVNDKFEFPTFTTNDCIEYFDHYFAAMSYFLNDSVEEKDFTGICDILNTEYNFKKLEFFKHEFNSDIFKRFSTKNNLIVPPLDYCYKIVNDDYTAQTRLNVKYNIGDVIKCNYLYSGFYSGSTLKSIERFYEPKSKVLKCIYNKNFAKNTEFIITPKLRVVKELNKKELNL